MNSSSINIHKIGLTTAEADQRIEMQDDQVTFQPARGFFGSVTQYLVRGDEIDGEQRAIGEYLDRLRDQFAEDYDAARPELARVYEKGEFTVQVLRDTEKMAANKFAEQLRASSGRIRDAIDNPSPEGNTYLRNSRNKLEWILSRMGMETREKFQIATQLADDLGLLNEHLRTQTQVPESFFQDKRSLDPNQISDWEVDQMMTDRDPQRAQLSQPRPFREPDVEQKEDEISDTEVGALIAQKEREILKSTLEAKYLGLARDSAIELFQALQDPSMIYSLEGLKACGGHKNQCVRFLLDGTNRRGIALFKSLVTQTAGNLVAAANLTKEASADDIVPLAEDLFRNLPFSPSEKEAAFQVLHDCLLTFPSREGSLLTAMFDGTFQYQLTSLHSGLHEYSRADNQ